MTYATPTVWKVGREGRDTVKPDMHSLSDADLVARLGRHEEVALSELYDRHAPTAYGLALRVLGEEHAAQEVVQDVFLALWERPGRYDPARAEVRAFVLVMVRSRALDRLRREKPTLALYDEEGQEYPLEDERENVPARAEQAALAAHVSAALAGLSAAHRETVERAFFRDESREEIALAMHVPVGTVKSRLKYALDKLRGVFSSHGEMGWVE